MKEGTQVIQTRTSYHSFSGMYSRKNKVLIANMIKIFMVTFVYHANQEIPFCHI